MKSIPEGDGTLLDNCCLVYAHEHAEANDHKNSGHAVIVAGHAGKLATGRHSKVTGTIGDLYRTIANEALGARVDEFPTSDRRLTEAIV